MRATVERMDAALVILAERYPNRTPKAFYLGPADWAEFMATDPPSKWVEWGNNPPLDIETPTYRDVPVRPSLNVAPRNSRLYDSTTQGRYLPDTPPRPRPQREAEASIHYQGEDGKPCCLLPQAKRLTAVPVKVTCGLCKRSPEYREMMQ